MIHAQVSSPEAKLVHTLPSLKGIIALIGGICACPHPQPPQGTLSSWVSCVLGISICVIVFYVGLVRSLEHLCNCVSCVINMNNCVSCVIYMNVCVIGFHACLVLMFRFHV